MGRAMRCWVLSEGLAGTENQCLGLAEALGIEPVVKRAKVGAPWRYLPSALLPVALLPAPLGAAARGGDTLAPPWPDLLIASGRKCVALALALRRASRGRTFTVFVQDPRVAARRFDLVIAPRHDGLAGPKVFVTRGALHRIDQARLDAAARRFGPSLADLPRPLVAVLVGGTTRRHRLEAADAARLGGQLARMAAAHGAGLALTASRRTGAASFTALCDALAGTPATIWRGEGENPYHGYLACADALVVTGDSISMVSEACATGKPVYVVPLRGRGSARFRRFHGGLAADGVIRPFTGTLEAWRYEPLRDTAEAARELRRRLDARRAGAPV